MYDWTFPTLSLVSPLLIVASLFLGQIQNKRSFRGRKTPRARQPLLHRGIRHRPYIIIYYWYTKQYDRQNVYMMNKILYFVRWSSFDTYSNSFGMIYYRIGHWPESKRAAFLLTLLTEPLNTPPFHGRKVTHPCHPMFSYPTKSFPSGWRIGTRLFRPSFRRLSIFIVSASRQQPSVKTNTISTNTQLLTVVTILRYFDAKSNIGQSSPTK